MLTIGILGGMGSYATLDIFRRLLDAFPAEKEWERPRIVIDNNCIMPSRVRAILYGEKERELIRAMSLSLKGLSESGCNNILVGCITAHSFLPKIQYAENVVDIVALTAQAIAGSGIKQTFALCSEGSRDVNIWGNAFEPYDIKVQYPSEEQMVQVRSFIEIVKQNRITASDYDNFSEFITNLPSDNIILGCTELPVLARGIILNQRIIDPIQIAIDLITEECHK